MILNRHILRDHIDNEHTISSIIKKATNFRINTEKMIPNKMGRLSFTSTFDADKWIEKQTEWIKTVRADWVEHNKNMLKMVEDIRDKLIIEEYKEAFISYIVEHCKNYNHGLYDEKDEEWFKTLANNEYDAQLESVGIDDLDFDNPENDAKECISYWD